MPLIDSICASRWFPPSGEEASVLTEEQETTTRLAGLLVNWLPNILRDTDGKQQITSEDVRVNYLKMHSLAQNATEMEIIIQPGVGSDGYSNREQGKRRIKIRDAVCVTVGNFYHEVIRRGYTMPDLTVEISVGGGFSGFRINRSGDVVQLWN